MRILERDKQTIYYQNYLGKTEKTKVVGGETIRLGEYEETYDDVKSADVYVSIPKSTRQSGYGQATLEPIGNVSHYRRTIVSETDLGITENSLVWIDSTEQADYRVESVGKSYHHTVYTVKQL